MPESPLTASTEDILRFAPKENFPVALRVLRKSLRRDLLALYGFARFVDNLGDDPMDDSGNLRSTEDRLADLDAAEHELDLAIDGTATHEIFVRLGETARRCRLGREDFVKLIDANRMDQAKSRYETWDDLMGYCELSANPVGRIVLDIFEADATGRKSAAAKKSASQEAAQTVKAAQTEAASREENAADGKDKVIATPENIALSDKICSALQVAEHLQDIGEDYREGRIYLPQEHWERFGLRRRRFCRFCGTIHHILAAAQAGAPRSRTSKADAARRCTAHQETAGRPAARNDRFRGRRTRSLGFSGKPPAERCSQSNASPRNPVKPAVPCGC